MELKDFITAFAEIFDETDASEITASTRFQELDEWSSLTSMGVNAMAKTLFGKTITGAEIKQCATVEDLFHFIDKK